MMPIAPAMATPGAPSGAGGMPARPRITIKIARTLRSNAAYVQRLFWTPSQPVQRQSGPALPVSYAAHRRGACLPYLRHTKPQGLCVADRRGGYRQNDADQQIDGMAPPPAGRD